MHLNSGIPNRAFYLVAASLGGYAWEHAGRIWYATLGDAKLKANATFTAFAKLTVANAQRLYPKGREATAVSAAWKEVGVL